MPQQAQWMPVDEPQAPPASQSTSAPSGWTPINEQPGEGKDQDIGKLHAAWNWLFGVGPQYEHKGLVEQFEGAMRNKQQEFARGSVTDSPIGSAVGSFVTGSLADAAKIERETASPPNAVAASLGALVPPLRAPIAAAYAIGGAKDALTGQQEGETLEDSIQRRLLGAATMFGGAAGVKGGTADFRSGTSDALKAVGSKLTDYAPQVGKAFGNATRAAGHFGSGAYIAGQVMHGDIPGAMEGVLGNAATELAKPVVEAGARGATAGLGRGMTWLGNLMVADQAGVHALPQTSEIVSKLDPKTDIESVADKALTKVQDAEQSGTKYPEQALGAADGPDKPYYDAARQQLGENADAGKIAATARDLKNQDAYLRDVILRNTDPRIVHGESALNQILTGQDNANLMKLAKSRGINVTQEAQLKPGAANSRLVNKIIDSFSPDELQDVSDKYLEVNRNKHQFGDIGPEAWKTMAMQTYFPDVKLPQTVLARTQKAIAQTPVERAQAGANQARLNTAKVSGGSITQQMEAMNQAKQLLGPTATLDEVTQKARQLQAQAGQ